MYHHIDKAGEILKDNNKLADFSMTSCHLDMCVSLLELLGKEVIELPRISGFLIWEVGEKKTKPSPGGGESSFLLSPDKNLHVYTSNPMQVNKISCLYKSCAQQTSCSRLAQREQTHLQQTLRVCLLSASSKA